MNSQSTINEKPLRMPLYGRLVQQMAEHACTIADRDQRQLYARRTVRIMAMLNPQALKSANPGVTLWSHLHYIAEGKLDIDWPVTPVEIKDVERKPVPYTIHRIRFRHYGHLLEASLDRLMQLPADDPERKAILRKVARRMRVNQATWKSDQMEAVKVAADIVAYTEGLVSHDEAVQALKDAEAEMYQHRPYQNTYYRGGGGYDNGRPYYCR